MEEKNRRGGRKNQLPRGRKNKESTSKQNTEKQRKGKKRKKKKIRYRPGNITQTNSNREEGNRPGKGTDTKNKKEELQKSRTEIN